MSVAETERPALHVLPPVPVLPVLRLLPAPESAPPYDDERALDRLRLAPAALVPAGLHLVPALDDDEDEEPWTRPRTALDGLAPARPFAHGFVQRLLEVAAGVRPLPQLQRATTPELYARLERWTAAQPRTTGVRPDARAVRSVRVQTAPEGVAEACATVRRSTPSGVRVVALALRFEGFEGAWCCTELEGL